VWQSIQDVEDTQEGATMHFLELSDLIEKVRANVDAIHVCKSYYMSHVYKEARSLISPRVLQSLDFFTASSQCAAVRVLPILL
jgi:hypothetical protein